MATQEQIEKYSKKYMLYSPKRREIQAHRYVVVKPDPDTVYSANRGGGVINYNWSRTQYCEIPGWHRNIEEAFKAAKSSYPASSWLSGIESLDYDGCAREVSTDGDVHYHGTTHQVMTALEYIDIHCNGKANNEHLRHS